MHIKKIINLFFLCYSFKSVKAQFTDTLFVWGLPDVRKSNAVKIISNKWKLQRYGYGCVMDKWLEDSLTKKNEATYEKLIPKYGLGWLDKYYDEIDKEYQIEVIINDLVNQQDYIRDLEIANINPGSGFEMYPLGNGSNYIVFVDNWIPEQNWKQYHVYKLQVDYKLKKVKILKKYLNQN